MKVFYAPEISDGELLGDYRVLGVLGRGPTGVTYHVESRVLGKEFALRALVLTEGLSLDWVGRLEAQTSLLSKLVHPYIDAVLSSGRSRSLWFCLQDFIHDGEGNSCNLRQYREKFGGRLSHHQVYHVTLQMVEALAYASRFEDGHHKGVFHGNLKPENVMIAYSESAGKASGQTAFEVKLTDFQPYGLTTPEVILEVYGQWLGTLNDYSTRISEEAVNRALVSIFGPYDYFAPEWKPGVKPNAAMDIYSVGVLIYEMLTGKVPEGRFLLPSKVRSDLPGYWDRVAKGCLQFYPEWRYKSFAELLKDLKGELAPEESPRVGDIKPFKRERYGLTPPGMVYIPAGSFQVGSDECGDDATPVHECETAGFYMDRAPVRNRQFADFVKETGYLTDAEREEEGPVWVAGEWRMMPGICWKNPTGKNIPKDFEDHPVTLVTLADAHAYCEWLGYRLPTEQEWEYAARGGLKGIKFPWGNTISRVNANYSGEGTTPVRQYQANGYGLFDMAGNVWEWTDSWYEGYPGNQKPSPHFGKEYAVVRGGAWLYDGAHCQVSVRNANQPARGYPTLGFRPVCDFRPRTEE